MSKKTEAGFSIFELIVVIFILSTILVAIASNMARTVRVLWENRSRSIAVNLAQNCIEDFNFNNSWRDWTDFRNSKLETYCMRGMTDLCGGTAGNECPSTGFDAVPGDISGQAPILTAPETIPRLADPVAQAEASNKVRFVDGAERIRRVYYDAKSTTGYIFEIKRYPAIVTYEEGIRSVGGGQVVINTITKEREAVIVVVDVYWERSSGAALTEARARNDSNHYQVAKQFMSGTD